MHTPTVWFEPEHVRRLYLLLSLVFWLGGAACHAHGGDPEARVIHRASEITGEKVSATQGHAAGSLTSMSGFTGATAGPYTAGASAGMPAIPVFKASSGTSITPKAAVDTSAELHSAEQMWERLQHTEAVGEHYYGFVQDFVWMGFTLENHSEVTPWYLEVSNNHINQIRLYTRVRSRAGPSEWVESAVTGRASAFSTRPVPHVNFVFDVELAPHTPTDVVLLLDKRRSSIHYPVRIWTANAFQAAQQRHYTFFGLYFGIFGIVALTSLVAFLFTRHRIYFWYLCYVLSVGLFVFVDIGLAQQYIYPESAVMGGNARMGLSYALVFTFIMFTMSYFRTGQHFPLAHRLLRILCIIIGAIAFTHTFFTGFAQQHVTLILYLLYLSILATISLALWVAVKYMRVERNTAILFIAAFSFIFVAAVIFIMNEFALIHLPALLFTPIQIGSAMEILCLSAALAWQVRFVEKKHHMLADRVHRLEKERLSAYIQGTEKERSRIALELHDAIGSKLGQLRRTIESGHKDIPHITCDVKEIIQDVRVISHKLAPPGLNMAGLCSQIDQLVAEVGASSEVNYSFQCVDVPERLPEELAIQLFRIVQEAIQNIEKHSDAEAAEIQLICHSGELVLTINDDGKGYDTQKTTNNGIGLENIKSRVRYIKGEMVVSAVPQKGTDLMITVPVQMPG